MFRNIAVACALIVGVVAKDQDITQSGVTLSFVGKSGQIKITPAGETKWMKIKWDKLQEIDSTGKVVESVNNFASQDFVWSDAVTWWGLGYHKNEVAPDKAETCGNPGTDGGSCELSHPYCCQTGSSSPWYCNKNKPSTVANCSTDANSKNLTKNYGGVYIDLNSTLEVGNKKTPVSFRIRTVLMLNDTTFMNGDEEIMVKKGSLKFTVEIKGWPFASTNNKLQFGADLQTQKSGDKALNEPKTDSKGKKSKKIKLGVGELVLSEQAICQTTACNACDTAANTCRGLCTSATPATCIAECEKTLASCKATACVVPVASAVVQDKSKISLDWTFNQCNGGADQLIYDPVLAAGADGGYVFQDSPAQSTVVSLPLLVLGAVLLMW